MQLEFCPDASKVASIEFRPFMIETAYDYYKTAKTSPHQRGAILNVLSALAVEIVLKSFNSVVSDNEGLLNECYQFDARLHDLELLAKNIRPDVRQYLLDTFDEEVIVEHRNTFTVARYCYEKSAPKGFSDCLPKLAAKLICKTIYLYRHQDCLDPFIRGFDINELYFRDVQRFAFVIDG